MLTTTTISGNLVADPELRSTPSGKAVTTLRVAVSDYRSLKETRYVDIDQWEDTATAATEHLTKGQHVIAEGTLDADAYLANDGTARIAWKLRQATVEWGAKPRAGASAAGAFDATTRRAA